MKQKGRTTSWTSRESVDSRRPGNYLNALSKPHSYNYIVRCLRLPPPFQNFIIFVLSYLEFSILTLGLFSKLSASMKGLSSRKAVSLRFRPVYPQKFVAHRVP